MCCHIAAAGPQPSLINVWWPAHVRILQETAQPHRAVPRMQCANAALQPGLVMILSGPPWPAFRPQVDYLVTPRVAACMIAGPFLNVLCFTMGAMKSFPAVICCPCCVSE